MAVRFDTNQYAEVDSTPVSNLSNGITLNGWFRVSSLASSYAVMLSVQRAAGEHVSLLFNHFTDSPGGFISIGNTDFSIYTDATLSDPDDLDVWHMATVTLDSTNTRSAYWNAGNKKQIVSSYTQDLNWNRVSVGAHRDSTPLYSQGQDVAECSLWNRPLTDREIASLYAGGIGMPPWLVAPSGLQGYWPLINNGGATAAGTYLDWWGQTDLTVGGTPTLTSPHPPILHDPVATATPSPVEEGMLFLHHGMRGGFGRSELLGGIRG